MKLDADLHCHTLASTHAYSTLLEMTQYAKAAGLSMIAITDHAPALPDAPHPWHFLNERLWPRTINGVTVLKGAEVNVMDYDGNIDLEERITAGLEWIVASFHKDCIAPAEPGLHDRAWLGIAENPAVDVIGHCGQPQYEFHYEDVLAVFKEKGKIVEVNENSLIVRKGSAENCRSIAQICKKLELPIVVDTDAHICFQVGRAPKSLAMLEEIGFPERLILNLDAKRICRYLLDKRGIII